MKVEFLFAWYDMWVGAYWDRKARKLYLMPVPMCGVVVSLPQKQQSPQSAVECRPGQWGGKHFWEQSLSGSRCVQCGVRRCGCGSITGLHFRGKVQTTCDVCNPKRIENKWTVKHSPCPMGEPLP